MNGNLDEDERKLAERLLVGITYTKDGCWLFGLDNHDRYTNLSVMILDGVRVTITAHRLAYMLWNGSLTEDDVVRHTPCDNTKCINPDHLVKGTHADNAADREERNRTARGEQLPQSKLTEAIVRVIRSSPESARVLGERYGVSPSAIRKVRKRQRWGWVND